MANLVTSVGLREMAQLAGAVAGGLTMTHLEVGTGALTPAAGTTALVTASSPRVATTNTESGGVLTLEGFFTNSQVNGTLTEWALYSALTGGTLLACGTFTPSVVKSASDTLTVTVTVTLTAG